MRRNNNPKVRYSYAPVKYVRQPQYITMRDPRRPTGEDTTAQDQSTPSTQSTNLREKDNFDRIASIAREAYDATRVIMGELNVEDKVYEVSGTNSFDFGNNMALQLINSIPQSVNEAGRTGDSVKIKGLYFAYRIYCSTSIAASQTLRARLFIHHHPSEFSLVYPFPTAIGSTNGVWAENLRGSTLATDAPRDYDNMDRCETLHDSHHNLTLEHPEARGHFFIKKHFKTQYENDSVVINTGSLTMGCVSSLSTVNGLYIQWWSRLYFVDN